MTIASILLKHGKITDEQRAEAEKAGATESVPVEKKLVELGFATELEVIEARGEQLSIPFVDLTKIKVDRELLKVVPSRTVHRYNLFPIDRKNGAIRLATSNPFDLYAFDELRMLTGCKVEPVLASEADILRVIREHYGVGGQTVEEMIGIDEVEVVSDVDEESGDILEAAQEATVVKLVNEILVEAIRDRASDIHIEPFENDLRIRYRIDGVLHTTHVPPEIRRFQNAIISRIKILSNLNIAEKRLPQDGGFRIRAQNRDIDLRVSIIPAAHGEGVVMRILDKQSVLLSMSDLGMGDEVYNSWKEIITMPHGIILVTGPTGSGKTTSLYAALNSIKSDAIKILTVEDPVEYYIDGINQVQMKPSIGLTFAAGLRAFLRHDPDVILVGEIRDKETAEVAINASLTGHLVFSTLHTNDSASAATRLLDMGVEAFLVSSSVEGVLAQRLVRRICPKCKEEYAPEPSEVPSDFELPPSGKVHRGVGCRECRDTGFKGRVGIYEFLRITDDIREVIIRQGTAGELLHVARKGGFRAMREDGWDKVREGKTTISEVVRVAKA
ncbi:MAG TPA: ATPase, T2SS/T4P/T4SS family [Phycisphaerae bacterium]|nr:Flp pilus assembly complex ATPase component TadA [Phycisphaerales bacterium]HNO79344.1 ATPase, T2SS/T4P/T4SS family [Phycisphaerae bacterium]